MKTRLVFSQKLPNPGTWGKQVILIFDQKLLQASPEFRAWKNKFPCQYAVRAGESLKSIDAFPKHIRNLIQLAEPFSRSKLTLVVVGGGSVGDFGGFVASILKRGVRLVHIPSTWLAALDSAHGGKTALNVGGFKNQIGTFYPASEIHLVRKLLSSQPAKRAQEAGGELVKVALLLGDRWGRRLLKEKSSPSDFMWRYLRDGIEAKYHIVEQDPLEQKGIRQLLNLGHTFGHVLEAAREVPHGIAVAQGIYFSLKWSLQRGLLTPENYFECAQLLSRTFEIPCWIDHSPHWRPLTKLQFMKPLLQDKKRSSRDGVNFIFLKGWGRPIVESVTFHDLAREGLRQGWVQR